MSAARATAQAPPLRELQEWLAFVMRHPATADVAVRAAAARRRFGLRAVLAGDIVRPNARMSVTDRLQVYNGGYLARLIEVLATDYPALQYLLGERAWHQLCARFVARHPSRHPNLNRLGLPMPAFVRSQRQLPRHAFAVELASLERRISDAFDAPEFTPLQPDALGAIAPDDWARARLMANPSLQLCAFAYPTNAFYIGFREEREPKPPRPRRTFVAVFRRDQRVFRLDLAPAAHAVLAALVRGQPLAKALQLAKGGDVGAWFRTWATDGLFTEVRVAARRRRR